MGHATIMVKGNVVVYTDPYQLNTEPPKADIILVSHEHYDHLDPEKIAAIRKDDTEILIFGSGAKKIDGARQVNAGETHMVKGVKVEVINCYNIGKQFHPKGTNGGFIFTMGKVRVFFGGDTDYVPEFGGLDDVDVALLPIGGTYTMNIDEAAKAAKTISPKIVIPYHYGDIPGTDADPDDLRKLLEGTGIDVVVPR